MRRILIYLWASVMTFCLGTVTSSLWNLFTLPPIAAPTRLTDPSKIELTAFKPPLTRVSGFNACGPKGSWHVTELSDGTRLVTDCKIFLSNLAASRALISHLNNFPEILEESHVRQDDVVLAKGEGVIELRRSGRSLCVTQAPSLKHLRWWAAPL